MWHISIPVWEVVTRALVVYVFLMVLLRFTGKRQIGQLAPFDLILLLMLSNVVQNAINGGDMSITSAVLSATTLVAINFLAGWLAFKSKTMERMIEGRPVILIHNGHINHGSMRKARMTMHELDAALRAEGHAGPECVHFAVLENNGRLTVVAKH